MVLLAPAAFSSLPLPPLIVPRVRPDEVVPLDESLALNVALPPCPVAADCAQAPAQMKRAGSIHMCFLFMTVSCFFASCLMCALFFHDSCLCTVGHGRETQSDKSRPAHEMMQSFLRQLTPSISDNLFSLFLIPDAWACSQDAIYS
jgi:hypothetical protein